MSGSLFDQFEASQKAPRQPGAPPTSMTEGAASLFDQFEASQKTAKKPELSAPKGVKPAAMVGADINGFPIFDDPEATKAVAEGMNRGTEKALQGATFGLFPYISAAVRRLGGTPFEQGLKEAREYSAQTSREMPEGAMAGEIIGGMMPGIGIGKLMTMGLKQAPGALGRIYQSAAGGAVQGALSSGGHAVGEGRMSDFVPDLTMGAGLGGAVGGAVPVLGTVAQGGWNVGKTLVNKLADLMTEQGHKAVGKDILGEVVGGQLGAPASSPLPGLELRASQAYNNPGLAALERRVGQVVPPGTDPGDVVGSAGYTPNQASRLFEWLLGRENSGKVATDVVNTSGAAGTQAVRGAAKVLDDFEGALWQAPELASVRFNTDRLVAQTQQAVDQMPPSLRMAVESLRPGTDAPYAKYLADLAALGPDASLAEVNAIRSRILRDARSFANGPNPKATEAEAGRQLAGGLLNAMESDPALAGLTTPAYTPSMLTSGATRPAQVVVTHPNQEAVAAYQKARDFTRNLNTMLDYPEFDAILTTNRSGNVVAPDEKAFSKFFDIAGGTRAGLERLQSFINMLSDSGHTAEAKTIADAAQNHLRALIGKTAQGMADDVLGNRALNMASGAAAAERMLPAVQAVPAVSPLADDLTTFAQTARLLDRSRVAAASGRINSPKYEQLMKDRLTGPILGDTTSTGLGALGGAILAPWAAGHFLPESMQPPTGVSALAGAIAGAAGGRGAGLALTRTPILQRGLGAFGHGSRQGIQEQLSTALSSPQAYQELNSVFKRPSYDFGDAGHISELARLLTRGAVPMGYAPLAETRR